MSEQAYLLRSFDTDVSRRAVLQSLVLRVNPEIARAVIENAPIMHPLPDRLTLYLRWKLSRTLYRLRGPDFAPKLELREQ